MRDNVRDRREMLRGLTAIAIIIAVATTPAYAVIFVNAAATGANNGASWNDAHTTIQAAVAVAQPGEQLWVAGGTYATVGGITLPSDVALFGGFAGTETSINERNWAVHETVFAGPGPQPSSVHVLSASNTAAGTVLDGFTVRGGYAIQSAGGGLTASGGTLVIRNCHFTANYANFNHGAGIWANGVALTVENSRFTNNYVHLGSGGGIKLWGESPALIRDCQFSTNTVVTSSGGGEGAGAGIDNWSTVPVTIERCSFTGNVGRSFYACCPVEIARGAGVHSFHDGLTIRDCVFRNNTAHEGAGLTAWGVTTVINSIFFGNVANSIPLQGGMDGGGDGGAITVVSFTPDVLTLINCTIVGNRAQEPGGVSIGWNAHAELRNTVVWGNIATGQDVSPINVQIKGSYGAEYSCIQDLLTPIPGEDPPDPANYPGCIVAGPQFVNSSIGDLHLAAGSPGVDAGKNPLVPTGVANDLDGRSRFLDDPSVPDTGIGPPPIVDMGAYEYLMFMPGDMNCDAVVDLLDAGPLAQALLAPADFGALHPGCPLARGDVNSDGTLDARDIAPWIRIIIP